MRVSTGALWARYIPHHGARCCLRILVGHLNFKRDLIEGVDVLAFEGTDAVGYRKVTGSGGGRWRGWP